MSKPLAENFQRITVSDVDNHKGDIALEALSKMMKYDYTRPHFGGVRKWFICRGCNARIYTLYSGSQGLKCRLCYDVTYKSKTINRSTYRWHMLHAFGLCDRVHKQAKKVKKPIRKGVLTRQAQKMLATLEKSWKITDMVLNKGRTRREK